MGLSAIINDYFMPELQRLGVPTPFTATDVLRPATGYHGFTIHTIGETLQIGPIECDMPMTDFPKTIPIGRKDFPLCDPAMLPKAVEFIRDRWCTLRCIADEKLLDYFEEHSQTPRCLFCKDNVNRLLELAGEEPDMDIEWLQMNHTTAMHYVEKALARKDEWYYQGSTQTTP